MTRPPCEVLVFKGTLGGPRVCVAAIFEPCSKDHSSWVLPGVLAAIGPAVLAYRARCCGTSESAAGAARDLRPPPGERR